MLVSLMLETLF